MTQPQTTNEVLAKLLREAEIIMKARPDLGYGFEGQPAMEVCFKLGKFPVLKFDNATRNLNIVNANVTILRFIADAIEMDTP